MQSTKGRALRSSLGVPGLGGHQATNEPICISHGLRLCDLRSKDSEHPLQESLELRYSGYGGFRDLEKVLDPRQTVDNSIIPVVWPQTNLFFHQPLFFSSPLEYKLYRGRNICLFPD